MAITLHDTLTGSKRPFEPLTPGRAGLYVCGPTVYDVPHMGHARPGVVFDVLRRHLTFRGYDVLFVRNITDVDDKIIARANELDEPSAQIAERYTRSYESAMSALGCLPPDIAPRASGHIPEMIELIAELIDQGYAYPGEGSVYFAVEKAANYGKLSGRGLDELTNRERVEPAPGKHHGLDFALWKAAKPDEPWWNSPWGRGRPGWHIECSVMATKYLGQPFDIHGGGADLIFPHHENEIAQSEASSDREFARYWLHNGHLKIDGEKMSKSLRNYVMIEDVLADHPAPVVRLFLLGAHYRTQMDHTLEGLQEAGRVWDRFATFLRATPARDVAEATVLRDLEAFAEAMDDDLNTPRAIAALHDLVGEGHRAASGSGDRAAECRAAVERGLGVLGCVDGRDDGGRQVVDALVELMLAQREQARADKDFARADSIRDRLAEIGIEVEDSADGPRWHLA